MTHTIKFRDGTRMGWDAYRMMMKGEISPFKAVAVSRGSATRPSGGDGQPQLAYDAKPRWARDQGNGGLTRAYTDATNNYLRDAGLSEEDCKVVASVLEKYVDAGAEAEDQENLTMREEDRVRVGGPRGPVGAGDRKMALDQYDQFGRPRRLLAAPMAPAGSRRGLDIPGIEKIRVL
jgi:hypothetical protein